MNVRLIIYLDNFISTTLIFIPGHLGRSFFPCNTQSRAGLTDQVLLYLVATSGGFKRRTCCTRGKNKFGYLAITRNYQAVPSSSIPHEILWGKPSRGSYKLNVDAYFFKNSFGAVASVLRNDISEALAGSTWLFDHVINATMAEAIAKLRGLEVLERLRCSPMTVEYDCQSCTGIVEIWSPSGMKPEILYQGGQWER